MAVQQNKKSPSKRGMHRSHNALTVPGIAVEPTTGETHLRHHVSPNVTVASGLCHLCNSFFLFGRFGACSGHDHTGC